MTRQEFMERHWRFYSMLEDKFTNTLQYVELDERNFQTFSMEFVSQIREIGSEIDVVLKELLVMRRMIEKILLIISKALKRHILICFNEKS